MDLYTYPFAVVTFHSNRLGCFYLRQTWCKTREDAAQRVADSNENPTFQRLGWKFHVWTAARVRMHERKENRVFMEKDLFEY